MNPVKFGEPPGPALPAAEATPSQAPWHAPWGRCREQTAGAYRCPRQPRPRRAPDPEPACTPITGVQAGRRKPKRPENLPHPKGAYRFESGCGHHSGTTEDLGTQQFTDGARLAQFAVQVRDHPGPPRGARRRRHLADRRAVPGDEGCRRGREGLARPALSGSQ